MVERLGQAQIFRRHGHARRHLHRPLHANERHDVGKDAVVAAAAALERALAVVHCADAVEADGDRKTVALEEIAVVRRQQRAVAGDGEADRHALLRAERGRTLGGGAQHRPVDQRLAAQERDIDPLARRDTLDQALDRLERGRLRHVLRRAAEVAALRIAIGAAEIALLRHSQRNGVHRERLDWPVVDVGRRVETVTDEQIVETGAIAPRDQVVVPVREGFGDRVDARAVGQIDVRAKLGRERQALRQPAARGAGGSRLVADDDCHFLARPARWSGKPAMAPSPCTRAVPCTPSPT